MASQSDKVRGTERLSEAAELLLASWPLLERSEDAWERSAERVQARIQEVKLGSTDASVLCAPLPTQFEERAPIRAQADAEARALRENARSSGAIHAALEGSPARGIETATRATGAELGPVSAGGADLEDPAAAELEEELAALGQHGAAHTPPAPAPDRGAFEGDVLRPFPNLTAWFGGALIGIAATAAFFVIFRPLGPSQPAFVVLPAQPVTQGTDADLRVAADEHAPKVEPTIVPATALETEEPVERAAEGEGTEALSASRAAGAGSKPRSTARDVAALDAPVNAAADSVILEEESQPRPAAAAASEAADLQPAAGLGERPPDRPSGGAANAAIGAVLAGARACVSGQEPSRATVVFRSDGTVERVLVTGPAVGTPAEACIQAALAGARVEPFARPTFSVAATVRPH